VQQDLSISVIWRQIGDEKADVGDVKERVLWQDVKRRRRLRLASVERRIV